MSKIWGFMLAFSIFIALISGNVESVINSVMESGKGSVENMLNLAGMMCFWSGIFNIFQQTDGIKKFSRILSKLIGKIFCKEKIDEESMEYISTNISMNVIGIGNAATINGIKAMENMQKNNKRKDFPTDNMAIFVLLNTASLQLIPTNMIALRTMYGSTASTSIVFPIWIVTSIALIFGIVSIKFLNKRM
ncbi:MAG: hypothetical protein RSA08_03840 [Clostridia bacterium]